MSHLRQRRKGTKDAIATTQASAGGCDIGSTTGAEDRKRKRLRVARAVHRAGLVMFALATLTLAAIFTHRNLYVVPQCVTRSGSAWWWPVSPFVACLLWAVVRAVASAVGEILYAPIGLCALYGASIS